MRHIVYKKLQFEKGLGEKIGYKVGTWTFREFFQ